MSSRAFWVGVFGGVIASALIGLFAVPALGIFEMTATGRSGFLDWWGNLNWKSSLGWRAPDLKTPANADPAKGFEHYRSTCLQCHGAPSAPRAEWAHAMQPMPPKLWEDDTQNMTDGELFYVIDKGVRMTGMPAFGTEHSEGDIWNIVALVRQLDHLTDEQKRRLAEVAGGHGHRHEAGGEGRQKGPNAAPHLDEQHHEHPAEHEHGAKERS